MGVSITLAIAVATADGIVVAADSRTTAAPPNQNPRVLSDFTHKVFGAGQCAIATYGYAFLLGRNVAGHMAGFVASLEDTALATKDMADRVSVFFGGLLDQHYDQGLDQRPEPGSDVLGFLVGGYEGGTGSIYDVSLPSRSVTLITPNGSGAAWRGQTDVLTRVLFGTDLALAEALIDEGERVELMAKLKPLADQMLYIIPFDGMNLQDAVDFASFAIRTTIDVQRLTHGVVGRPGSWPGVGGPIEIAAVTPTSGFRWVQQTTLQGERSAGVAEI